MPGNTPGFVCTACGSIFDADVNAAKNILKLGISPTGGLAGMACESARILAGSRKETLARAEARPFRAESSHRNGLINRYRQIGVQILRPLKPTRLCQFVCRNLE
jgi:hypothetical protein